MAEVDGNYHLFGETTCGALLQKLQEIWDDVGESDEERDRMLLQLEQECLDVYKRKVDHASKSRALLLQALAGAKAELSFLVSALGELNLMGIPETSGTINEQIAAIAPALDRLMKLKEERVKEFSDVQSQIHKLRGEISGASDVLDQISVDESDLSLRKLDQFQAHLRELQKEKSERLHRVLELVSTVHDLCAVLGMDFYSTVTEVHPSLNDSGDVPPSKSISNDTLSQLANTVQILKEDKKKRLQKLQGLATQLIDLWNLMDTPEEERSEFDHITCNISAAIDEVTFPGALALDLIEQAKLEVERLDQLKASKMKEIAFKKQNELDEIFARAHIETDSEAARKNIMFLIDSVNVEPTDLLADMDNRIAKAKEEALSRKEILEKVEKWMSACEEENWLEDYNRDDNRYSATRGAHLNLKRAEKARVLVSKIPGLVESLVMKTRAWEQDHGATFSYDGVPLLVMLDEYTMLRHDRVEEKRRLRDQKRFQGQLSKEQEAVFGAATPSPARQVGTKKAVVVVGGQRGGNTSTNGSTAVKRFSLNIHQNGSRSINKEGRRESARPVVPVNYVAIAKDDVGSYISGSEPFPGTP